MQPTIVIAKLPPLPRKRTWFLPALLIGAAVVAGAADRVTPAATQPYILYMGADINVEWNGAFYVVQDVQKGDFVINPRDEAVKVPVVSRKAVNMRVKKELKLGDRIVQVTALQVERVFTPGRDPGRKFVSAASAALTGAADLSAAAGKLANAENAASSAQDSARLNPVPGSEANLNAAQANLNNAQMNAQAGANMAEAIANENERLSGELAAGQEQFDAVEVSFRLSSAKPLTDLYVVIVAEYRAPGTRPRQSPNWIYATEIEAIDDTPRTVRFKQGGLPPGFELLRHEVHFYSRGREIASTVADKAVPLTRAEAHEYLMIDHLALRKGETLPAALALGAATDEFLAAYDAAQLQQVVFVQVDSKGLPGAVFLDEARIRAVRDPFLESVIREARFLPALKSGKPVDGVARLKIADLAP